jgi:hypothetical protein
MKTSKPNHSTLLDLFDFDLPVYNSVGNLMPDVSLGFKTFDSAPAFYSGCPAEGR